MRYKVFFITVLTLSVFASFNYYNNKGKVENSIYEYYQIDKSGSMERKGTIGSNKLMLSKNIDIAYNDIEIKNFVMREIEPESLLLGLIDIINEFCAKESCKTYDYLGKDRRSIDHEVYHFSNNIHASVYSKDLVYFTIPDESNRPSKCLDFFTNMVGASSCVGLDERYYYNKYSKLINNLVSGQDVDITYNFDPLYQNFNFIVTFKFGGIPSTIKWFLDFGPTGLFSFVGTNFETELTYNFKNISLKKSLEYYIKNKTGYKLLPKIEMKDVENLDLNEKNEITIKKIGSVVRFYTGQNAKIYLLPFYELYTNKGIYLLLGSEKV